MKSKKIIFLLVTLLICVVTLLVAWLATNSGDITVEVGTDSLTVSATEVGATTVLFDSVKNVKLVTTIDLGTKTSGIDNSKISAGEWAIDKYDDYGDCYLFTYKNVASYIVITTNSRHVIVNCDNVADTQQLYENILLAVEGE